MDRCAPVQGESLVPRPVLPDDLEAAVGDLQEGAPRPVGLRDEDLIAHDQRARRVDALEDLGPPGEVEVLLAAGGVERDQSSTREVEAPSSTSDGRQGRSGVAGQLVAEGVADLARALVEGHDPGAVAGDLAGVDLRCPRRTAADRHDQQIPLDDRRAARAEEVLDDTEALRRVEVPKQAAVLGGVSTQPPFDSEGVDAVAVHHGGSSGSVAVVVVVLVLGAVLGAPQLVAGARVERCQAGGVVLAIEVEEAARRDGRHAVALAGGEAPTHREPSFRPALGQPRLVGRAVSVRAPKGRPVGDDAGFGRTRQPDEQAETRRQSSEKSDSHAAELTAPEKVSHGGAVSITLGDRER